MQKVYVFGDSIAQGIFINEQGHYQLSRVGCVELLKQAGYPLINYAMDGYTIRQGFAAFQKKRLQPGSVCVIEFGANDSELDWDGMSVNPNRFYDGKTPLAEFPADVERFVMEARSRDLKPLLVTPIPLMTYRYYPWICRGRNGENLLRYFRGDPESILRWQERFVHVIRETAARLDCPLMDLRKWMVHELDFPHLICIDGIHPNEAGHALIARMVMECYPLTDHA